MTASRILHDLACDEAQVQERIRPHTIDCVAARDDSYDVTLFVVDAAARRAITELNIHVTVFLTLSSRDKTRLPHRMRFA